MRAADPVLVGALSNRRLELILMPTEACNFRCTYCYEDFALGRMSRELVGGIARLLDARAPSLDSLTLAWFGGEPLLAPDIVLGLQEHALALAEEHPSLSVHASMTTNGWKLVPALFERLVERGVREYQISFDGPPEQHDARRLRQGGRPSFARIWENVLAMRDSDRSFQVVLRLHVDRENLDSLFGFTERIREELGHDRRFSAFLKPLSRYGGPNDAAIPVLESEEDGRRFRALERHVAELLGAPSAERAGGKPEQGACYATHGNSFVVRADGRVQKCTVALDHPANTVGRLAADGTLEIDSPRMRPWMRGLFSGESGELLCPLIGLDAALAPA